ncbi:MAG: ATP-binding cassette domain-containing protein [Ardenticatenales bacterium]|nr:ATP-binding cassette domain-containing protein [Ardenticatenales bacterium]
MNEKTMQRFDLQNAVAANRLVGLWRMMTGYRLSYVGAVLSIAVAAAARTVTFFLLRYLVDDVLGKGLHLDRVWLLALGIIGLAVVEGGFTFLRGKLAAQTAEGITRRLRDYLYDHLQRLPFEYHDRTRTGELIERVTSDVEAMRRFYAEQGVEIGRILALFVFNLAALVSLNAKLGLLSILFMPFVLVLSLWFFGRISKAYERYQEQEAVLSARLQENLTGVRVVRAFARQPFERDRFEQENWEKYQRGRRLLVMHSLYWPASDVLCTLQMLLIYYLGARMAIEGTITVGTYVAIAGMVIWIIWPMRNLGRIIVQASSALVSYRRVADVIGEKREDMVSGQHNGRLRGEIVFDDVCFEYKEGEHVLDHVSFRCEPGQVVALLGPTGSGKSSLVNLLPRFYDYDCGSLTLDGTELVEYPIHWLRQQIGIVEQEPFLFSRTIRENIAYGSGREVTDKEIEEAAQAAAIHDVILSFPEGYDTLVGEKGVTLSGGQKQRVAIARTLLKDPRILVLDDATSSVDTETEALIREALERLMEGRTSFIIAHRIQTIMQADKILVLDKGRIVQQGAHRELIQQDGLYKQIYELQAQVEHSVGEVGHVGHTI